jgi:hypothetical protein
LPQSVVVPAGKTSVEVAITVYHVHGDPTSVAISAAYGGQHQTGVLTVTDPDAQLQGHFHHHVDD